MLNTKSQKKSNEPIAKNQEEQPSVQVRRLTVSQLSAERERLTFDTWQNRRKVPYLKFSGVWLEKAGFTIASKVNVIVRNNLLIIENLP